jgi:hypothetical protein
MFPVNSRASYLFKKYYNKSASPDEIKELFYLLNEFSDDDLTRLMLEGWENLQGNEQLFDTAKSKEILAGIIPEKSCSSDELGQVHNMLWIRKLKKLSIAASVIIILGFGLYFFRNTGPEIPSKMVAIPVFNDVAPGGNRAILKLANGRQIILDSLENGLILRTSNVDIKKTADGQLAYQVFKTKDKSNSNPELNTIYTPRGGEYRVILPDGSRVWLNAASSIKFPTVFRGAAREVELIGEAYFEVAKDAQMPFKVMSGGAEIEVLGTHFNIRAYNSENAMKTTLVEGSVKIKSQKSSKILKPGQQAVLEDSRMQIISNIDVEVQIAWKNGLFQFKDASLENVMKQAALWYDLKVIYSGNIPQKQFTGKISRKVNASEFLNMLRYVGVDFKREGKNVTITD